MPSASLAMFCDIIFWSRCCSSFGSHLSLSSHQVHNTDYRHGVPKTGRLIFARRQQLPHKCVCSTHRTMCIPSLVPVSQQLPHKCARSTNRNVFSCACHHLLNTNRWMSKTAGRSYYTTSSLARAALFALLCTIQPHVGLHSVCGDRARGACELRPG